MWNMNECSTTATNPSVEVEEPTGAVDVVELDEAEDGAVDGHGVTTQSAPGPHEDPVRIRPTDENLGEERKQTRRINWLLNNSSTLAQDCWQSDGNKNFNVVFIRRSQAMLQHEVERFMKEGAKKWPGRMHALRPPFFALSWQHRHFTSWFLPLQLCYEMPLSLLQTFETKCHRSARNAMIHRWLCSDLPRNNLHAATYPGITFVQRLTPE